MNKNKKIIYLLILSLIFLTGCSYVDNFQNSLKQNKFNNLESGLFDTVIKDGEWVYYVNNDLNDRIYKIKPDGTMKKKITSCDSGLVGIKDEWVYYVDHSSKDTLCRIKKDGTGKMTIVKDSATNASISGENIYYINYMEFIK
jgi:PBP1b-binding outer membrane lipoprotein LpoB